MAENNENEPSSPPLPKRGQYNIDFDALDEFSDPFTSSKTLSSSPPIKSNHVIDYANVDDSIDPFKPSAALSNSPPCMDEDPFKSKPKLGNLPPSDDLSSIDDPFKSKSKLAEQDSSEPSTVVSQNNNVKDISFDEEESKRDEGLGDSQTHAVSPTPQEQGSPPEKTESKDVTPKKKRMIKKPKVQSKFKPPKHLKQAKNDSDDIQIFMPGIDDKPDLEEPQPPVQEELQLPVPEEQQLPVPEELQPPVPEELQPPVPEELQPPVPEELEPPVPEESAPPITEADIVDKNLQDEALMSSGFGSSQTSRDSAEREDEVPYDAAPDAMASSGELDQQYIDREDLEEPDQAEFEDTNEAMAEPSEMDLMDKFGDDSEGKAPTKPRDDNSVLSNFDARTEEEKSSRSRPLSAEIPGRDADILTSSPANQTSEKTNKHPAVRALESLQADDNKKQVEPKSESSSEEAQFFDALDYPPTSTAQPKFGQKSPKMDKSSSQSDMAESKGSVVQLVQVLRYSQTDWNKLKQELELNFQTTLLNKERDWSLLLAERDSKISSLEDMNKKLKHTNEDMRMVVTEFEKTISQLQADKEKSKTDISKSLQTVEHERDQALEDLASVENAFSDLHRRYEKSKTIIDGFKRNEEQLKQCVEDLQNKLKKSEAKMQLIKAQAEEQLDKANEDIDKLKKATRQDIIRLEASVKKSDLRISSLEESLQRKEKENQELTAICDELISKVGT